MAKNCGCSGATCGCKVIAGAGITVTGTGTAVDPFIVTRDTSTDNITGKLVVDDTTTIDMTRLGSGTTGDPYVIKGAVRLVAPNGTPYTIAVSNSGVLSAVAL